MNPSFMLLTIGAMASGVAVLSFGITRILALLRGSEIARLPASAEGNVAFPQPGRYVLRSSSRA